MQDNTGGAAFPNGIAVGPAGDVYGEENDGMSLRDYFASRAPQPPIGWLKGRVSASMSHDELCQVSVKAAAEWSYLFADAMLAARDTSP